MRTTKPKVAFFDFTGCEGCQLTVIDSLQTNLDLLDAIEIVAFREAMSDGQDTYEIAFVEGSYSKPGDEERLRAIRDQAQIVIALGACAHLGGVNAIRNLLPSTDVRRYVYGEAGKFLDSTKALPIEAVIPIDGVIPGCPIDRQEFIRALKALLQGRVPRLPNYPVCVECKLRENVCLFLKGTICLGPVTRAGCQAICPSLGAGCDGCRGLITKPNMSWLSTAAIEYGNSQENLDATLKFFLSKELAQGKVGGNGNR